LADAEFEAFDGLLGAPTTAAGVAAALLRYTLVLSSKCLALSDKSGGWAETTKERERLSALVSSSARGESYDNPPCVSAACCDGDCDPHQCR